MHIPKSDKYQSRLVYCGILAGALAASMAVAEAAAASEQVAQAIPTAPFGGIYAQTPAGMTGALGKAIDEASSTTADDSNQSSSSSQSNKSEQSSQRTAGSGGAAAINLPRIDASSQADDESRKIAQAASQGVTGVTTGNGNSPVDLAPVKLLERTSPVFQANQFQTGLLYKLPAKMFFYSSTENSLRLETNVLQTLHRNRADLIYRVLPNVTVGYAFTNRTRVSANYFFLRDQYTRDNHFLSRNFHSIGAQIQHDIPITEKTNVTAGFQGRQLLISRGQPLSDLLPSVQLTHRIGARTVVYGGVLGQIRFRNTLGKFQEGDQFYSFGGMYRTARWFFLWDNTFITNFGNRRLRFGPNNQNMIMTLEADYRISPRLPLVAFVRAQPIFNIGADEATGFAGFNFRIFGGIRIDLNKSPIFPVKLDKKK